MSDKTEIQVLLEKLADAFNSHDLERVMSYFAEDCSLDMPRGPEPWGTRYDGWHEVRKGLATRFETVPDVHYGDCRHFVAGDMGVTEWLLTGTSPEGTSIEVRGCDHYQFKNGKVVRKDSYWKIVE